MNMLISPQNRVFNTLVDPSETRKSQIIYIWLKIGTFQAKNDNNNFFNDTPSHFTMFCKMRSKISDFFKV